LPETPKSPVILWGAFMNTDSIFSDNEKDLAPIFSPRMVSITMGCLWVLGIILVLTWPFKSLSHYIEGFRIPQTFLATFAGGLIMGSYLNLRCALGEIIPDSIFARLDRENVITYEEERGYLSYGFPISVLHTLVLHLLMLPFLILGAAVTGISQKGFGLGMAILFTASLLCRQVAFFLLLIWGRWRVPGYLGARVFYFLFLFATVFIEPFLNPILLLLKLHYGESVPVGPTIPSLFPYFLVVLSAIFIFLPVNQWIIRRNNRQRGTP
jgi:hypothetical protein